LCVLIHVGPSSTGNLISISISVTRKLTLDRAKIGRSFGHVTFIFHPCNSDRTVVTCSREVSGISWSAARHRSGAAPPPLARLIRPLHSPISFFPLLALACLTPPPPDAARSSTSREGARRPPQGGPTTRGLAGRREGNPPRPSSSSFTRPRLLRPSPPPPTTTASIPAASAAAAAAESSSGVGDANECAQRLRERRGCSVCPRAGKQVAARALSC